MAVEERVAARQERLGAGAGELRPEPGQRDVEPEVGQVGAGDPLAALRRGARRDYQIFDRTRALDLRITSTMARSKKLVLPKRSGETRER